MRCYVKEIRNLHGCKWLYGRFDPRGRLVAIDGFFATSQRDPVDQPIEFSNVGKKSRVVQSTGRGEDQAAFPDQGLDLPEGGRFPFPVGGCRHQPIGADAADQGYPRTVSSLEIQQIDAFRFQ